MLNTFLPRNTVLEDSFFLFYFFFLDKIVPFLNNLFLVIIFGDIG